MEKMNREDIKNLIPHREPMLLIDEVERTGEDTCIGYYIVKGDEYFLQGHFPGNPVVPGVILCEMMAQASCIMLNVTGATPYFTSLNNVKFKSMVKPGDKIMFDCFLTGQKDPFYFVSGKGFVNEKLCVSADMSFAIIKEKV